MNVEDERTGKMIVLMSGGVDSAVLAAYLKWRVGEIYAERVTPVFIHYGQSNWWQEVQCVRHQCRHLGLVHTELTMTAYAGIVGTHCMLGGGQAPALEDIESGKASPPTVIPYRNLFLATVGMVHAETCGEKEIWMGFQGEGGPTWDASTQFVNRLNLLAELAPEDRRVTFHTPFVKETKTDVIRIGESFGVNWRYTWTCFRSGAKPCGMCCGCATRRTAFAEVGIKDPTDDESKSESKSESERGEE